MTTPTPTPWFCLKTKPRQEAVAVRNLQSIGGIQIVFPRVRRTRRGHHENKLVIEPLFPGYLFASFNPSEVQTSVRGCRGVQQLVSRGNEAVLVDPSVISELQALGPEAIVTLVDEALEVGTKVRVIRGIFEGTEGEVLRLQNPQARIAVLLNLLGSDQPVMMPVADIEALKSKNS